MPGQLTRHSLLSNYLDMREVLYATRDSFTVYSTVHVTAVTSHKAEDSVEYKFQTENMLALRNHCAL